MRSCLCILASAWILLFPVGALASDHADPTWLPNNEQEANLTGLFFFPDGDRYVIILDTRPSLTAAPPYHFAPYAFAIDIDTHSAVQFPPVQQPLAPGQAAQPADAHLQMLKGDFARYGGTVTNPDGIGPDVKFTFRLENDATLQPRDLQITGLRKTHVSIFNDANLADLRTHRAKYGNDIWVYTGVRDDPFIFPKFFNVNIVAMAVSVPKSAFQTKSQDWLLWASSNWAKTKKKIDHVGRSNRTQLARFDVLNTEEPNRHVQVLRRVTAFRIKLQDFFKEALRPVSNLNQLSGFVMRAYDYEPDVMIYSTRYPSGFPNGRRLEDDVAAITCANGDCPLQENSYIDSSAYPRTTKNDKPFLPDFPYLAERWPYRPQPFVGSPWHYFVANLLPPIILVGVVLLLLLALWRRICARLNAPTAEIPES